MPNSLYDDEDDYQDHNSQGPEFSVGTTSIIGIFFVLALVCAGFSYIGYSLGRRQGIAQGQAEAQTAAAVANGSVAASTTPKPAPGSLATPAPTSVSDTPAVPTPEPAAPMPAAPEAVRPTPAKPAAATAVPPTGAIIVQIAALTHEEDANNEVSELQKRGYNVFARHDPNDRFIRIQIGPFANRKEAKDMCDRLLASGYNAIIK